VSSVRLKTARQLAADYREQVALGIDPIEARKQKQAETLKAEPTPSFDEVARRYITANRATWRSVKHAAQWESTLAMYASPIFGKLPINQIDTGCVLRALEPHWHSKTETMSRVRNRIEKILGFATVRGWRSGDNPARWSNHLSEALARPSRVKPVEHHASLPYEQVAAFMTELRQRPGITSLCLQFLILTATRSGEARGATWAEVDMKNNIWIIPAARMKSDREHRVPLSEEALAVLKQVQEIKLPVSSSFVFPNDRTGESLSVNATLSLLARMKRSDLTTHGFRSSFRTWAAERTNFAHAVAEAALAHATGDRTEKSYQRGDMFEKRAKLMDAWAAFCNRPTTTGAVVSFAARV
jgi:integrase